MSSVEWQAWALRHDSHGQHLDSLCWLPSGEMGPSGAWIRIRHLDFVEVTPIVRTEPYTWPPGAPGGWAKCLCANPQLAPDPTCPVTMDTGGPHEHGAVVRVPSEAELAQVEATKLRGEWYGDGEPLGESNDERCQMRAPAGAFHPDMQPSQCVFVSPHTNHHLEPVPRCPCRMDAGAPIGSGVAWVIINHGDTPLEVPPLAQCCLHSGHLGPHRGPASETKAPEENDDSAATSAFDAIAKLCGVAEWDYPGQLVRDVQGVVLERDGFQAEVVSRNKSIEELKSQLNRLKETHGAELKVLHGEYGQLKLKYLAEREE